MLTSYAAFVGTLASLSVTGVIRMYAYPPQQVNASDLPIQFVRVPSGNEGPMTLQTPGGWPRMACEIVILTSLYMHDTNAINFGKMLMMMDNLSTALRRTQPAKTLTTWDIRNEGVQVGDALYWAILATVRGNG